MLEKENLRVELMQQKDYVEETLNTKIKNFQQDYYVSFLVSMYKKLNIVI